MLIYLISCITIAMCLIFAAVILILYYEKIKHMEEFSELIFIMLLIVAVIISCIIF